MNQNRSSRGSILTRATSVWLAVIIAVVILGRAVWDQRDGAPGATTGVHVEQIDLGRAAAGAAQETTPHTSLGLGALTETRPGHFQSPAGLIYGPGSEHGHRLQHLMAHARDNPDRPGPHGVFSDGRQEAVVALVDEAYRAAVNGAGTLRHERGRDVINVNMQRKIGYAGGQQGRRNGHPECRSVRIVLNGKRVITAFPVQ